MNSEKYNKFISMINLKAIELESISCKQNKNFSSKSPKLDISVDFSTGQCVQDGVEIIVPVEFSVAAIHNGDEKELELDDIQDDQWLFSVDFTIDLKYYLEDLGEIEDGTDFEDLSEIIEQFAELNVPVNAWPYARELVSSLTMRMGFPPLFIPPYKKQPKY